MAAALAVHSATAAADTEVKPYSIDVPASVLEDLQYRLAHARFPQPLDTFETADQWAYGTPAAYMKELTHYWLHSYNWTEQQAKLNQFPQFTTEIEGLSVHFLHVRSKAPNAIPLILSHGWPGSVLECTKVIPLLTDERASIPFHVVCPSLPGYGFSEAPKEPGFDPTKIASMFVQLMERLGYTEYVAQGGDWGSAITTEIGMQAPQHCRAIHINFLPTGPPSDKGMLASLKLGLSYLFPSWFYTPREIHNIREVFSVLLEESGYLHLQATKPHTVGFALNDSPVGLAAYIVEKFRTWGDCRGDVENSFSKDELLTNIMIYWVSQSITPSMRLYYEQFHTKESVFDKGARLYVTVPTGVANFPKEVTRWPRSWVEYYYNVTHWSEMQQGGHFAALEEPQTLVSDIRVFVGALPASTFAASSVAGKPSSPQKTADRNEL